MVTVPPAVTFSDAGVTVGPGTVSVADADVPPPGAGLNTVIWRSPAEAMSVARIAAVTCVASTYVVVRGDVLSLTSDVGTKLVPVTVNVKAAPPAATEFGASSVIVGTGLITVTFPLVASFVKELLSNSRALHTVPGAVGAVNVTTALATPTAGATF